VINDEFYRGNLTMMSSAYPVILGLLVYSHSFTFGSGTGRRHDGRSLSASNPGHDHPSRPAGMSKPKAAANQTPRINLEQIAITSGAATYKGYRAWISAVPDGTRATVTVRRGRKLLSRTTNNDRVAWLRSPEQVAFFPLLGKRTKQLIVAIDSGAAHCCLSVKIYDLFPRFRKIYDSKKYDVGETWYGVASLTLIEMESSSWKTTS
jgi:hypothetical protein